MASGKWLITGSVAAHHWFPEVWTKASDVDFLSPVKIKSSVDLHIDAQWHDVCAEIIERNSDEVFVDPDMLFTIKFSHAEWDIKWQKTMIDIWKFQKQGCVLHHDIIPRLKEVWKKVHGPKRVNLKQPVSEFFSHDVVQRTYPHESVHEAVKFHSHPMHEMIRPDPTSVWCDVKLFEGLSFENQLRCAMEEIMVTAIERRKLTSQSGKSDIWAAITFAHRQLVVSMTTGWFNNFLILNAPIILSREKRDIMTHQIKNAIEQLESINWRSQDD